MGSSGGAIVLFDGVCNLCNGAVQFILARDPGARFQFAALQSETARRLLGTNASLESLALVEAGQVFRKSAAVLRIARKLRFPWTLLYVFVVVPRPARDLIYDWVARHRYGWFGKRDTCAVPTPGVRERFLD